MIDISDENLLKRIENLRKETERNRYAGPGYNDHFNDGVDAVIELIEELADAKPEDVIVGEWGWADSAPLHIPSYQKGIEAGRVESADLPSVSVPRDTRPHSRACGYRKHEHGTECSSDCPTCGGNA